MTHSIFMQISVHFLCASPRRGRSTGYWHHGIYVGKQIIEGYKKELDTVVDFWGEGGKETCDIAMRPYINFATGAAGWAKASYTPGAALDQSLSAKFAIAYIDYVKEHPITYSLLLRNCEVFATMCRCLRSVMQSHNVLCKHLQLFHTHVRKKPSQRFK